MERVDGYRGNLTLLRERTFAQLMAARTLSMLAIAFAPVAIAFGVLDLPGATASTLSAVVAAEYTALVVFTLAGGVVADRYPRHRVLMVSEAANAVTHVVFGIMLLRGDPPLWALITLAALSGTVSALVWPAMTGIVPDVVPADRLQPGNALLGLGGNVARVLGLVAGGAVVVAVGAGWALIAAGLSFAVAGVLIGSLRITRSHTTGGGASVFAELRDGWQEFRSHQWLWVVVIQFSVLVMVWQAAHLVLGPVVAKAELGGAGAWTAVLTGEALGLVLGVLIAMRVRPRRPILVGTLCTFAAVPPYLLLGLSAPLWAIVAGAFVMGLGFDLFAVLWQTTVQQEVPPESLSRVSSYDVLGSMALGPLGLVLAGPAADAFGPHPALVGCAVVMGVCTVFALCFPGVRNLRARHAPAAEVVVPALDVPVVEAAAGELAGRTAHQPDPARAGS